MPLLSEHVASWDPQQKPLLSVHWAAPMQGRLQKAIWAHGWCCDSEEGEERDHEALQSVTPRGPCTSFEAHQASSPPERLPYPQAGLSTAPLHSHAVSTCLTAELQSTALRLLLSLPWKLEERSLSYRSLCVMCLAQPITWEMCFDLNSSEVHHPCALQELKLWPHQLSYTVPGTQSILTTFIDE